MDKLTRFAVLELAKDPNVWDQLKLAMQVGVFSIVELSRMQQAATCVRELVKSSTYSECPLCGWIDSAGADYCPCGSRMLIRDRVS